MQLIGHSLGHHIGLGIAKIQSSAHIPDGTAGSHGAEGSDLGHMVGTVLFHDIVNNFAPAFLAEVRIEIGHANPLGIQKSLKNEGIFHGVNFRDVHTVGNDGSSTGATARTYGNARFLGITDEIPDDEIIIHIPHAANNIDLIFQTVNVCLGRILIALLKALIAELAEVFLVGIALRHRERGQMVLVEYKFQVAHIGNFNRILKSLVAVGEKLTEFFLALKVKFLSLEFHTVGIVHGLAGLDAKQHILHGGIFPAQIVGIICNHQRKPRFPGKAHNTLVHRPLLLNTVILQFKVKAVLAEDIRHGKGVLPGGGIVVLQKILRDGTCQAGRQGDQALMALPQKVDIHSGLAVKALRKGLGDDVAKVFVTGAVFAEQHQVIWVIIDAVDPVFHPPPGNIDLTADNRLDTGFFRRLIKIDTTVHYAMVCNGNGGLSQFLYPIHHAADTARTVKKAVFGMDMQMYKAHFTASFASSTSFFSR